MKLKRVDANMIELVPFCEFEQAFAPRLHKILLIRCCKSRRMVAITSNSLPERNSFGESPFVLTQANYRTR